jgi:hypothetical protein
MILRVGIEFSFKDEGWLGGNDAIAAFRGFARNTSLRTLLVDLASSLRLARRSGRRVIGGDTLMERCAAVVV